MTTPLSNQIIREITPLSDKDCFYIAERYKTEFTYPIHNHSEFELNFTEKAAGVRRIVGDSSEVIGDYDLVIDNRKRLGARLGTETTAIRKRYGRLRFSFLPIFSSRALSIRISSTLSAGCWIKHKKGFASRCLPYSKYIRCWIRLLPKNRDFMRSLSL